MPPPKAESHNNKDAGNANPNNTPPPRNTRAGRENSSKRSEASTVSQTRLLNDPRRDEGLDTHAEKVKENGPTAPEDYAYNRELAIQEGASDYWKDLIQISTAKCLGCGRLMTEHWWTTLNKLHSKISALLRNIPEGTADKGPSAFAFELAKAARLKADQLAPVALKAHEMQKAWEAQGKPARLKPVGRLIRMLIVGGGGCGKSRINNLVLTPLFVQYWGPRGCVKAAPSNKAARGILGKTLHAAANLPPGRH